MATTTRGRTASGGTAAKRTSGTSTSRTTRAAGDDAESSRASRTATAGSGAAAKRAGAGKSTRSKATTTRDATKGSAEATRIDGGGGSRRTQDAAVAARKIVMSKGTKSTAQKAPASRMSSAGRTRGADTGMDTPTSRRSAPASAGHAMTRTRKAATPDPKRAGTAGDGGIQTSKKQAPRNVVAEDRRKSTLGGDRSATRMADPAGHLTPGAPRTKARSQPAASEERVTSKTASPYSPARLRGTGAANREEQSAAGVGAGGAPGAGGRPAAAARKAASKARKRGETGNAASDALDARKRPTAPAGITQSSNYQGGGTRGARV